jgi:hypothetical protein
VFTFSTDTNKTTVAQGVSRLFTTATARVQSQVRSCKVCGGQHGLGADFLVVLRFPLPLLIPTTAPYLSFTRVWYNGSTSGRRTEWTHSHLIPRLKVCAVHTGGDVSEHDYIFLNSGDRTRH